MQQVPADIWAAFERHLDQAQVPADQRPDYHKWVRYYFDFCHKYGHSPAAPTSLGPFLTKLASKNQSLGQRGQASAAVLLLIQAVPEPVGALPSLPATPAPSPRPVLNRQPSSLGQALQARSSRLPPPAPRAAQPPPLPPAPRHISEPPRATRQDRPIAPVPQSDGGLSAVLGSAPTTTPARGHGASWQQEYRDLEAARSASGITRPGPWRLTASGSLSFRPSSGAGRPGSWAGRRCGGSCQIWPCGRAWPPRRRTRRLEQLMVES